MRENAFVAGNPLWTFMEKVTARPAGPYWGRGSNWFRF